MHLLVYHYGALGDFIAMLPLFSLLKKIYNFPITLLGKPSFGLLAKANNYIDKIVDAECSYNAYLFSSNPDKEKITAFLSPFDRIYLFTDANSFLAENVRTFSSAYIKNHTPFTTRNKHIIDYNLELVQDTISIMDDCVPDLSPAVHNTCFGNKRIPFLSQKPVVAIHPGSGSPIKNWHYESFIKVSNVLRSIGYSIAWFTGPAETIHHYPDTDLHFHNVPLLECAVLLSQCTVYCGNDCGITHLAAAVGCPTVAIFGPSDPKIWVPRGKKPVRIVYHPETCSPCHLQRSIPCQRNCLKNITTDEVIAVIVSQIEAA
jgi:ADP-heptose:LPS heptosyltransferase